MQEGYILIHQLSLEIEGERGDDHFLPRARVFDGGEQIRHALTDAGSCLDNAVLLGRQAFLDGPRESDLLRPILIARHMF